MQMVQDKEAESIVKSQMTERVERSAHVPQVRADAPPTQHVETRFLMPKAQKVEVPNLARVEEPDHESLVVTQAAEEIVEVAQGKLDGIAAKRGEAQVDVPSLLEQMGRAAAEVYEAKFDRALKCTLGWKVNCPFAGKAAFEGK
ncbi:unnamed protein product [Prorocentrum cordatum]|uniref:Dynein light chain n=1 Tax=Prorocentrum cordatum TaxID=2364126 RepID=A0ABN9PBP7_9DINO|nr:unnamed protein product [Polarella glacialis]